MRKKSFHEKRKKVGAAPGLPKLADSEIEKPVSIDVIIYGPKFHQEYKGLKSVAEIPATPENCYTWVNVYGLHNKTVIHDLGQRYHLHQLTLEDIVTTDQRAKMDQYEHQLYLVMRMIYCPDGSSHVRSEQLSVIYCEEGIISIQEDEGDIFDPNRARLKLGNNRLCNGGPDYLLYSLIDTVVDYYFVALDQLDGRMEGLEHKVFSGSYNIEDQRSFQELRHDILFLRKSIWPLREVLSQLTRLDEEWVDPQTQYFLKDVYDHIIQVMDVIEMHKENVTAMTDVFLTINSNRMNGIMKVLTVISTIFIPLTFITGIYGMNFKHMPELEHPQGYYWVLGTCVTVVVGMLVFFKWKKYI
jgi:magnesium transporter